MGFSTLHGGHQVAPKSTRTVPFAPRTSRSNVSSFASIMTERVPGLRNLTDVDPLSVLSETARAERTRLVAVARREGLAPEDAVDCVQDAFCTYLRLVSS